MRALQGELQLSVGFRERLVGVSRCLVLEAEEQAAIEPNQHVFLTLLRDALVSGGILENFICSPTRFIKLLVAYGLSLPKWVEVDADPPPIPIPRIASPRALRLKLWIFVQSSSLLSSPSTG